MLTFLRSRKIIGPFVVCFVLRVRVKKTKYCVLFLSYTFFYKEHFFATQRQCCLTFLWTELHLFLRCCLILSWRRPLSYRNQSIDLLRKSMDWFLHDNGLRHERVNAFSHHYIETDRRFSIFGFLSSSRSIYVVAMWPISYFQPHFHYH